jgi:hypothetical protein
VGGHKIVFWVEKIEFHHEAFLGPLKIRTQKTLVRTISTSSKRYFSLYFSGWSREKKLWRIDPSHSKRPRSCTVRTKSLFRQQKVYQLFTNQKWEIFYPTCYLKIVLCTGETKPLCCTRTRTMRFWTIKFYSRYSIYIRRLFDAIFIEYCMDGNVLAPHQSFALTGLQTHVQHIGHSHYYEFGFVIVWYRFSWYR